MFHETNRGSQGVTFFESRQAKNEIESADGINFTVDGVSEDI